MRLKSWRAGLQDAELVRLAQAAGHHREVERLLRDMIPRALADGRGQASWPTDGAIWHRFHRMLLELASAPLRHHQEQGGKPLPPRP
jgi:hypothetical protein